MKIDHVAIWANDIEKLKIFYEQYFGATPNVKYVNDARAFSSYFLSEESLWLISFYQLTTPPFPLEIFYGNHCLSQIRDKRI